MGSNAKFWNKTAEKYSRSPVADQDSYDVKLKLTREHFTPKSKVLEFACGTGTTAILHAPFVEHLHAIDVSEKMIEIARAKLPPAEATNVTFEVADIEGFQADRASFDVIMGHSILHLLKDRMTVMRKVHELLKPGGVFVSSTVCLGDGLLFKFLMPLFPLMHALGQWPLVRRFTAQRLQADMESVGFKIVKQWQPGTGKSALKSVFLVARKA